jgi:hypothetical protein
MLAGRCGSSRVRQSRRSSWTAICTSGAGIRSTRWSTRATPALESGFSYDVRTQLFDGGDHHVSKDWKFFENEMSGDTDLYFYDDPTNVDTPTGDPLPLTGLTADGRSWTPLCLNSAHLGLGLQGTGLLQLEELTLYFSQNEF